MNKQKSKLKIAFCITCMNRLSHLQKTLIKNIEDNNLPGEVEFVLLDYNSSDGLSEWVKTLTLYLDNGILVYYRTDEPLHYKRSHSRNMAFRLSNADVLCNLDADNYLGKGFADYIIETFRINSENRIFITSNCFSRDLFGRICVLKNDFQKLRGYDEAITDYGSEDVDLFYRFTNLGYEQIKFDKNDFYSAIRHSHIERISQEKRFLYLINIYIKHRTPYSIDFIVIYKDNTCELGTLTNNILCNFNINRDYSNFIEMFFDERFKIMVDPLQIGTWTVSTTIKDEIIIDLENRYFNINTQSDQIKFDNNVFYKIKNEKIVAEFIMNLSNGVNFNWIKSKVKNKRKIINPLGFGKGVVFRNFEKKEIILN